jgi:hypothetical protein
MRRGCDKPVLECGSLHIGSRFCLGYSYLQKCGELDDKDTGSGFDFVNHRENRECSLCSLG